MNLYIFSTFIAKGSNVHIKYTENKLNHLEPLTNFNNIYAVSQQSIHSDHVVIGVWIDTYVFYQSVLQKKTWIWSLCVAKT